MSGGSALPLAMMEKFRDVHGVHMSQGWGMTETSPVCTFALVGQPAVAEPGHDGSGPDESIRDEGSPAETTAENGRGKSGPLTAGRLLAGVEMRIVTQDGEVAPWDGATVGEVEVRGPWITGSYLGGAEAGQFHDGWFRTGDLGTLDAEGYLYLSDRLKDTIKSGGEWISVDPAGGRADGATRTWPRRPWWASRTSAGGKDRWLAWYGGPVLPSACDDLKEHLSARVVRWWVPDHWVFVDELPKTRWASTTRKCCAPVTQQASSVRRREADIEPRARWPARATWLEQSGLEPRKRHAGHIGGHRQVEVHGLAEPCELEPDRQSGRQLVGQGGLRRARRHGFSVQGRTRL